ncbi:MAG: GNAT family N-acetyltransferase, partial [Oscillospiraceae bacterium]|nr:GNAT family N-acetyltransferase [Oscillospiraceae bacterium]
MIIRYIKKEDQEEFCKTSSAAFIWEMSDDDLKDYPEEQVLAAFCDDNKTIMAQIEVLPFKNIFCGKHLLSSGIGGVASRPEYRRQGAVRKLFLEYFDQAVAEGQVLSGLYPFSTNYYRQFGYEPVTKCISVLAPFSELAKIPRNCNAELFEGSRKQLNKLLGIYNAYAENYNLMFQRTTDKYFSKEPYKKNLYTYMWNDGKGKARSYATF